jgi:hypothetical protein
MGRDFPKRAVQCVLASLALFALGAPSVRAADPTLEDILKVWEARAKKAEHVKLTWKSTQFVPRNSYKLIAAKQAAQGDSSEHPPQDLQIDGRNELVLSGTRYRYDCSDSQWDFLSKSVRSRRSVDAFDGTSYVSMIYDEQQSKPIQQISKPVTAAKMELNTLGLLPIMYALRGADASLFIEQFSRYELTGRSIPIRGRNVIEFQNVNRMTNGINRIYLDTDRDYTIVRLIREINGVEVAQLEVESQQNTPFGWLPSQWTYTTRSRTKVIRSSERFSDLSIEELPTDVRDRLIPTPGPSTAVVDVRKDPATVHIIREDGTASAAVPLATSMTREELASLSRDPFLVRNRVVVLLLGSILVIVTVIGITKMRRR